MKIEISEKSFRKMSPCGEALEFCAAHEFDWPKIWASCDRSDWMIWALRRIGKMDKALSVKIAVACAEHVLAAYEKNNAKDKRPAMAIVAARNWLEKPSPAAAADAAAASDAAYAAYAAAAAAAAADAAYAAAAAADAAAYDADAAAADADAAAYAAPAYAYAASRREKWLADKIRQIVGEIEWGKESA